MAFTTRCVAAGLGRARSAKRGGVSRNVPTKMATAIRVGSSAKRTVILWPSGPGWCSRRAGELGGGNPRKGQGIRATLKFLIRHAPVARLPHSTEHKPM